MAVMAVVSTFTEKATAEQLQGITYFSQSPEQIAETRSSWSKWDIFNTVVVLGICIAFYVYFW
jgi:SSS family solute:Na+ symporter